MEAVEINLPCGLPVGEEWCRRAWVHPITGHEEDFLMQAGRHLSAAARTTQLISRCLIGLGPLEPVGIDTVRQLSIGDREALLLHLRRLTLGDRISCLLSCPACKSNMDLDLQVEELLLPPYPHCQKVHETEIGDQGDSYIVTFRLPNGDDQEVAAVRAAESVASAADLVLQRCIAQVTSAAGQKPCTLPEIVLRDLPEKMAELDPQAELLLNLTCPECQAGFVVPFDAGDYLYREVGAQEREFYRGVHALSLHYHWNEQDILGLGRRKRHIYLDLLADEFGSARIA